MQVQRSKRQAPVTRVCQWCGREFVTKASNVVRSGAPFCQRRCADHGRARRPLADRFWSKVDKNGPVVRPELGPCWLWTGTAAATGYGKFQAGGRGDSQRPAHQIAWELAHGQPFPDGMEACHRCDLPQCVRPDHIFPGTRLDNMRDALEKGRVRAGARHPMAKLDEAAIATLCALWATGKHRQWELAGRFGITQGQVSYIVRREARK